MNLTQEHRYCLKCWYVLDGLTSSQCPECSRHFDPQNSKTYATQPRLQYQFSRMLPVAGIAMLLLLFELICVGFVWTTMGEVMSGVWAFAVLAGNFIIFLSMLLRRRRLTTSLAIAFMLVTCSYPAYLRAKHELLVAEVKRIITYAETTKLQTGSYPIDLRGYQFKRPWTSSSIAYDPQGFYLHWWAHQRGVSHRYANQGL